MKNRFTGIVAAVGLACLAPTIASAHIIGFDFGSGDPSYFNIGDSGLFAGYTGEGSSVISRSRWWASLPDYVQGNMRQYCPPTTHVSEPATTALLGAGLLMAGALAYRRRRVDITRK